MTHKTETFALGDPRDFDGDAYTVASRACAQVEGLAALSITYSKLARLMARNAAMERNLASGMDADAAGWEESAEAKRWDALVESFIVCERNVSILKRAAGFNPKAPLGQ